MSGKLADDALVLYDRETESEWRQATGECIAGAFEGARLTPVESAVTTFATFRETHPDGQYRQYPEYDLLYRTWPSRGPFPSPSWTEM